MQSGWTATARAAGLDIDVGGMKPLSHFGIKHRQAQAAKTLFTQKMLDRGYLATTAFYATYAHSEAIVAEYLHVAEEVFGEIKQSLENGDTESQLRGAVAHSGFARLT